MRYLAIISACVALLAPPATAQDEDGGGFLERTLEDSLSGAGREVTIIGFAGALSSQATLEEMTIADADGVWLRLTGVTLDWTRSALLRGRIEVNRLAADEISLLRPPMPAPGLSPEMAEAQPFALPELPVSVRIDALEAETIVLGAPVLGEEVRMTLEGALTLGGGAGEARLVAERRDGARGTVNLDAAFDNESRVLALDLAFDEGPGGIAATLLDLPDRPAVTLTIAGEAPLDAYAADLRLATGGVERVTGRVTLDGDTEGATRFEATLGGDLTPLMAEAFRPFFGAQSTVSLAGARAGDGALEIERLSLSAAQLALDGTLALDAAGWPVRFDLTGEIGGGSDVRLPVAGPPVTLRQATLTARYDAAAGDRWRTRATVEGLAQPGVSVARATLSARGQLRRVAPRGVSALAEFALDGLEIADAGLAEAAGRAVSGHASLDWREGKPLEVRGLRMTAGAAVLAASGRIAALAEGLPVEGTARVDAPDLARFAALAGRDDLAGAAEATLSGSGSLLGGDFDVTLDAETEALAVGIAQADPLLAPPGTLSLRARRDTDGTVLERLRIANSAVEATASGRLDGQSGALDVTAAIADLGLADRRLDGPARLGGGVGWQAGGAVTLDGVEVTAMGAEATATGRFEPGAGDLPMAGRLRLHAEDLSRFAALAGRPLKGRIATTLEAEGTVQAGRLAVTVDAEGRDLATGIVDLDRLLAGRLDMRAKARRTPERIEIEDVSLSTPQLDLTARDDGAGGPVRVAARLADLGLFLPEFPGAATAEGTVTLHGPEARRIALALDATGPGGTTARVTGDVLDHGARIDLAATGRLPLALANGAIRPNALSGSATFDLRADGPPGLSALSGTVGTQDAQVSVPDAGLAFDDLSGTARLGAGRVETEFAARLRDGGRLRVSGPVSLDPGFDADLSITLDSAVLTDRLVYTTTADGTVTVRGALAGGARIGGGIELEQTEIRIPSGLGPETAALPGLRHVGEPAASRVTRARAELIVSEPTQKARARPYPLDLTIRAPARIFVRGRGLDAELGGRLRIGGTSAAVAPDGFFELRRGRLDILGKRLELTEGRVTMQGSLDPWLRFVAETVIEDVEVQVIVEGLASAPEVRFSSAPDLPQEEIVARLIFGRGLDNISPIQAAQLASAVAKLSGGGAGLVERLRSGFGLSDLDVTQTAEGDTEVSAGAYISDKIYTEITADSTGRQKINLNLDVTRNLTAKGSASSDGNTGIGIFFEKDY
ncbi:translocation/assembly module TamB domain-containing protein [Roseovarius ramblicola]|uniref:Translocation/assembly module TamB domain-containing protein n=1 Tax=Roseovarius ramblicola TaxID=2022336 RepID=A0ABV5HY94_9RHOB